MMPTPLIAGLSELAPRYDALICDVWGVIHDGRRAHPGAAEALARFRAERGPAVLLTNAPRLAGDVSGQLARFGVGDDAYDAIVTSGEATRRELRLRAGEGPQPYPVYHLGPERDLGVFNGLNVRRVGPEDAQIIVCTGPFHDEHETPEEYRGAFAAHVARGLPMICANPDLQVQRGEQIIWCAGGLARLYEALGGTVAWMGKPHRPVFDAALAEIASRMKTPAQRILMIGDGLRTDIAGANAAGIDALLVTGGLHAAELAGTGLDAALDAAGVHAVAAIGRLAW